MTVQRTFAMLALAAGVSTSVQAQRAWQPEIGFQAGYSQSKPAGTGVDDKQTFIMLPGVSTVVPVLTYGSLYAIIPWSEKVAVEPTLGFSQFTLIGGATAARLGARINYALTPKVYGAAGGVVNYFSATGSSSMQLGLQVGLGYRLRFTQSLNGRIEAQWVSTANTDDINPFNTYSVLVGVSTPLTSRAVAPARGARAASTSVWRRSLGINGGYSHVHLTGGGDAVFLAAPGIGGSLGSLGVYVPGPATLFAIFPIGRKIALEPGLDIASIDQGSGSAVGVAASARLNYAFSRGWYGAVGGQLAYVNPSAGSSASVFGGLLAWGNRFRLTSNLGGRVELNYLTFPNSTDLGSAANTFSVLFGLTVPLK
jgi:hypothetical protein